MSKENSSDSSTSDSEVSACSPNFNALKALYSKKTKVPVENAPLYDNFGQYQAAQSNQSVIPIGFKSLVSKREEEKLRIQTEKQKEVEEINKNRFSQYQGLTSVPRQKKKSNNVLTRMPHFEGPLGAIRECVDKRIRVKITTRGASGVRGVLYATVVAFDKQWNLAMTDVLEVWQRKGPRKRKIPPGMGQPVAKGTAASISPIAVITETPLGHGIWECTRHLPQLFMRGEHVVMINVLER